MRRNFGNLCMAVRKPCKQCGSKGPYNVQEEEEDGIFHSMHIHGRLANSTCLNIQNIGKNMTNPM